MDYLFLPPEVNSARIYAGPGSGPLLAAAAAWQSLSDSLADTVAQSGAVAGTLAGAWTGPSSAAMQTSLTHYLSWVTSTSTMAQQSAAASVQAAAAYETAFISSVPPAAIAENRTELTTLVATNVLGQNTPAIMMNEATYAEYWAQDVEAMSGYQNASQSAVATLPAFTPAPDVANPAAATTAATTASPGGILETLNNLFSFMNNSNDVFGPNANFWNGILGGGLNPATLAPVMGQMALMQRSNDLTEQGNIISEELAHDDEQQAMGNVPGGATFPARPANPVNPGEAPTFPQNSPRISERPDLGIGHTAGNLSVPPNWDKATNQVKLASMATPLEPGAPGMGMPTPIAAVNGPDRKKPRDGNEILVKIKFVPEGI
jgi:PPE-repeat protein